MAKTKSPRVSIDASQAAALVAAGLIPADAVAPPKGKRAKAALVEPAFIAGCRRVVAVVPVATVSEANARAWQGRSNRTRVARQAVSRLFGRHLRELADASEAYHRGDVLRVTLTRLGGKKLDAMSNLGASLKACEDSLALMLGADDGAKNWRAVAAQEPGGPVGVRIELAW